MNAVVEVVAQEDPVIRSLERARAALVEARTMTDTKSVIDVAAAAELYAKRQKLGKEAERLALAIKIDAMLRLGEMLRKRKPNIDKRFLPKSVRDTVQPQAVDDSPTLADLGIDNNTARYSKIVANATPDQVNRLKNGELSLRSMVRKTASVRGAESGGVEDAKYRESKPAPSSTSANSQTEQRSDARIEALQEPRQEASAPQDREDVGQPPIDPDDAPVGIDQAPDELMEELRLTVERLTAEVQALSSLDGRAEIVRAIRAKEYALREKDIAIERAANAVQREQWAIRQLKRCGKAVGTEDLDKIAAMVESLARKYKAIQPAK